MNRPNPFTEASDAERYQIFRPVYHHIALSKLTKHYEKALDVACGTGHSTEALTKIANNVVGCDVSEAMLQEARKRVHQVPFIISKAEALPFDNETFDLVHMSMAFHWVDQAKFLNEAKRVLKKDGHLSLDNYGFRGTIKEDPAFSETHAEFYKTKLPPASRGLAYPNEEATAKAGLKLIQSIKYDHEVSMTLDQFIGFITTQSNFLVLPNEQKMAVVAEMQSLYEPFFSGRTRTLNFGGELRLYGRTCNG